MTNMRLYLITYDDHLGLPRHEYTSTATGAWLRVEELESEGYTNVSAEA
jgi:hypothetical protein